MILYTLLPFDPKLPLRLSDKREIRDFAEGNIPADFQGLLSLFNRQAKSLFANVDILIVDLGDALVGRRGDLSVDLQPLHDELNGSVAIASNIAVGLDARLYDTSIRPRKNARRNRQANLLGCFQIDHQLKLRGLFHRQIGGLSAFEDFIDVRRSAPQRSLMLAP